jgi:hypothetical protein
MHSVSEILNQPEIVLQPDQWQSLRRNHEKILRPEVEHHINRRSRQEADPVMDFLFDYYHFRPAHLLKWTPGYGTALAKGDEPWPELSELHVADDLAYLDPALFPEKRIDSLRWMIKLLSNSASKKPVFACFGMHEWAMVYRSDDIRHSKVPLRMAPDELAAFVESRPLLCTHYDAFRFFTPKAEPLNHFELSRDTFAENEQPGCIHSNMDLYKWSFKLYPWVSSEIIREAFFLAKDARYVDMKASPYDLRSHGLEPIRIETDAGRRIYMAEQKRIFKKGVPLRKKLLEALNRLLLAVES